MLFKLNYIVIFVLNFLYIFRSLSVVFRVEFLIYLLTPLVIGINLIHIFRTLRKQRINIISIYVFVGITLLVYSMVLNPPIVGIMGFGVLFVNLLFWNSFIKNISKNNLERLFKKYIQVNVYFACIISIIGIYQYFVDPSIMGLAIHDIYGSICMMESGLFTRRATSLMGSPQNYSLYLALITSFVSYATLPKIYNIIVYNILLYGGLVSGSRAYFVFLIIVVLLNFFMKSANNVINYSKWATIIALPALSFGLIIIVFYREFYSTVIRMFILFSDWPVLEIYKYHLGTLIIHEIFLGKGLGLNERIVANILGARYYDLVGVYFLYSYESYFLSVFMQLGVMGVLLVASIFIKSMIRAYKHLSGLYFSILVAILINLIVTPSFNGLAISFIIWPVILYPLYIRINIMENRENTKVGGE